MAQKKYEVALSQINNSFSGANYLPYSVGLLQVYAEKHLKEPNRFKFLLPLYKRCKVDNGVKHFNSADLVGFSLYVWNELLSLEILRKLKKSNPEKLVICGGPQVPDNAEEFLRKNPQVDLAVHGEGENTFLKILEAYPENDWSDIPGISWIDPSGKFITHAKSDRMRDLSVIPSPYLENVFEPLLSLDSNAEWLALWETNRGCPFACTFCDWGSAIADKVFRFDMDRIDQEMDWFSQKKIEFVFTCDANFGILPRDLDIAQHSAENKERYGYPKALSVQNTKNATERAYQTQKILSDSGLNKGVTLSMQTISQQTLEDIKRQNISLKTYDELQRRFTRDGVITYSDLILGLPGETYESFVAGVSSLITNGQHNRIQFNNLSVLPNAEMADPDYIVTHGIELVKSKILNIHGFQESSEDDIVEMQDLVIGTKTLPQDQWRKVRAFSWMTGLLHFNKLLQIPLILLHRQTGVPYHEMIEMFMGVDSVEFPLISEIRDFFLERAKSLQKGGPEFYHSRQWLGILWPDDEYIFIRLATEGKLDKFYEESKKILSSIISSVDAESDREILFEALKVNRALIKLPNQFEDGEIETQYNILDVYYDTIRGGTLYLEKVPSTHTIKRSQKTWSDWEVWCREVVWWGNKKGDYLYGSHSSEKYYAGHY
jgi:radical SAM superfamily enzyme YgiQ (UPF0313 family)